MAISRNNEDPMIRLMIAALLVAMAQTAMANPVGLASPLAADDALANALVAEAASGSACPAWNQYTGERDPDHYYAKTQYDIADEDLCKSCGDPANKGKTACAVYRQIEACLADKTKCRDDLARLKVFSRPGRYEYVAAQLTDNQGKPTCHYVTFALPPTIGVEDRKHRDIYSYWDAARHTGLKIRQPKLNDYWLGLAINPATVRGQHQLHIHSGRLSRPMRAALDKQDKTLNKWTSVTLTGARSTTTYSVTYMPRISQAGPGYVFANASPFERVSKEFGESKMPFNGIIVAASNDNKGFFILAAENHFTEGELDYAGSCKPLQ